MTNKEAAEPPSETKTTFSHKKRSCNNFLKESAPYKPWSAEEQMQLTGSHKSTRQKYLTFDNKSISNLRKVLNIGFGAVIPLDDEQVIENLLRSASYTNFQHILITTGRRRRKYAKIDTVVPTHTDDTSLASAVAAAINDGFDSSFYDSSNFRSPDGYTRFPVS